MALDSILHMCNLQMSEAWHGEEGKVQNTNQEEDSEPRV